MNDQHSPLFKTILVVFLLTFNITCYSQQEPNILPKIAYVATKKCSDFYDGIATIGNSYSDDIQLINRHGEILGIAPGQLLHSDTYCRIFDRKGKHILTDLNNKVIKKSKDNILYISPGLYFLSNGFNKGGTLVNQNGKTTKQYKSDITKKVSNDSPYIILTYKSANGDYKYDLFIQSILIYSRSY